jgi:hypothetical protein
MSIDDRTSLLAMLEEECKARAENTWEDLAAGFLQTTERRLFGEKTAYQYEKFSFAFRKRLDESSIKGLIVDELCERHREAMFEDLQDFIDSRKRKK